jgi:hypothetical protein
MPKKQIFFVSLFSIWARRKEWLGRGYLGAVTGVEGGVGQGAVALVLDGLPVVVKELEEALEDGGDLLLGESQGLHGVNGAACPLRPGSHPAPIRLAVRAITHEPRREEEEADQGIALLGFATAIRVSSAWLREGEAEGVQLN